MELFADYCRAGFVLCPILPGHKSPVNAGWQQREIGITDPAVARELPGVGLCHAWSGTACLDIDDFAASVDWCAEHGIDLQALWDAPEAVKISSGRPNRGKLLFRVATPLPSKKVIVGKQSVIDFRCASRRGLTLQDVLPGTVHPDTQRKYEWVYDELLTHWSTPPQLPDDVRAVWESLITPVATPNISQVHMPADAQIIRDILATKDPDCDRDSWVKILSEIHLETRGEEWGFALADEWSSRGEKYAGSDDVRTRWNSFNLNHPAPATMQAEIRARATPEEFPPVPPEQAAPPPADPEQLNESNKVIRKKATGDLEDRLVYVIARDQYYDTVSRRMLVSDHALRHMFSATMPWVRTESGRKRLDPVDLLKNSATKKVVDVQGFHPGAGLFFEEEGVHYVNTYAPRPIEPLPPTKAELDVIRGLFNRINDPLFREWLLKFYAHSVQKPGVKILSAPLIWSEMTGNGKSTLTQEIPTLLYGQEYSQSISHGQLASDFNDYLAGKWFIHLSEMHADQRGERTKVTAKLKAWITDPLAIHPKGSAAYTTRNSLIITAASNNGDAAMIENNDRRWGIHELKADRMTEAESADVFEGFLRTPRAAGVLRHYFLNMSTVGFRPTAPAPETGDRKAMINASLPPDVDLLVHAIEEQRGPFARDLFTVQEAIEFLRQNGIRYLPSITAMGTKLSRSPLNCISRRVNVSGDGAAKRTIWCCRNHSEWESAAHSVWVDSWRSVSDPLLD